MQPERKKEDRPKMKREINLDFILLALVAAMMYVMLFVPIGG